MIGTESKPHWTQELKQENERLRAALDYLQGEAMRIGDSRLAKEHRFPHEDPNMGLAYRQCAEEVCRLAREAVSRSHDIEMGAE